MFSTSQPRSHPETAEPRLRLQFQTLGAFGRPDERSGVVLRAQVGE